MYPSSFKFDKPIQLGLVYKTRYYYNEACECLHPYPFCIEKIDCLTGSKKSEEAANEVNDYIFIER